MKQIILIQLESYRDDGRLVDNENEENEYTLEEAIDCVIQYWRDMPMTYHSWDLKKVIFKEEE